MKAAQQGFSLVELMVGLLLAAMISLMALMLLWQQQNAWREQLAVQQLQEEGQLVMQLLQDEIDYAGGSMGADLPPFDSQATTHGRALAEHSTLNFHSQDVTDCLGRELAAPELVTNQYYARLNSEEVSALYCRAFARNSWEEVELVRGVEVFQARVLVEGPGQTRTYKKPEELTAADKALWLEILLVLRHPDVEVKAEGTWHYRDPWGGSWWLENKGLYRRFLLRRELLNG